MPPRPLAAYAATGTKKPDHRRTAPGEEESDQDQEAAEAHDTSLSPWERWEKVVLGERHCCDDSEHNPATSRDRMLVAVVFGQFAVKTAVPSTEPQEGRNLCYSAYP
ncbi:hypothetical protein CSOJ01_06073 [Colletotrichum sojae]|uniref:Uncharacterized protein n=1 Tax=Colletotrichum sojae TaxID=2175907 RepID=A0A8H6MWI2_9PEZI|nr:hypothetical protein CSOJ01_06073 [Colletotrichum sojae]